MSFSRNWACFGGEFVDGGVFTAKRIVVAEFIRFKAHKHFRTKSYRSWAFRNRGVQGSIVLNMMMRELVLGKGSLRCWMSRAGSGFTSLHYCHQLFACVSEKTLRTVGHFKYCLGLFRRRLIVQRFVLGFRKVFKALSVTVHSLYTTRCLYKIVYHKRKQKVRMP